MSHISQQRPTFQLVLEYILFVKCDSYLKLLFLSIISRKIIRLAFFVPITIAFTVSSYMVYYYKLYLEDWICKYCSLINYFMNCTCHNVILRFQVHQRLKP